MPRLRKLRRKQKFQYHVNRRKLNQQQNKLPRINCDAIRNSWDAKKSMSDNLAAMGLVADATKTFSLQKDRKANAEQVEDAAVQGTSVATTLENEAKEAFVSKKAVAHLLPSQMVKKLVAFLDKHGEDFEAMAMDPTNFYQETPAQLKSQVNRLKKVPQQWIPYLRERGLLNEENVDSSN